MSSISILYLGSKGGTSAHRATALQRLGHEVYHLNPDACLPQSNLIRKFHYETGGIFADGLVASQILPQVKGKKFDLVWVDHGRYVGPKLLAGLRDVAPKSVLYNTDNPFVTRDRYSFLLVKKALSSYDGFVTNRVENIADANRYGQKHVLRCFRTADEVVHAPPVPAPAFLHEVGFVGTNVEKERGKFLADLVKLKVPLSLYGGKWDRSPYWEQIKPFWKGPGTTKDSDYTMLIANSKISLGLLSAGNEDLHTRRSIEIPAIGGLFCAQRTSEHLELYDEGAEAVYWEGVEECAEVIHRLLADEPLRQRIAAAGHQRAIKNNHYNEPFCARVIKFALEETG